MKKTRVIYGFLSPLFLVAGMLVYFLFRDWGNLIFFAWIPIPIPDAAGSAIIHLAPSASPSPFFNVVRFNLNGALWLVAGILFFRFVWFHRPREQKAYIACFCGTAALLEISQLSPKVPGTFDPLDLLFMGIGAFAEGLIYNIFVERRIA